MEVQERAAWATLWLQWHPGWLLVIDNVEDPADLRHYLGTLPDGHHLVTSRTATGWHAIAPTMPLGLLDAGAAVDLLCTLAFGAEHVPTPAQRGDAAALAADLGYLPLTLEQAGAYLFETGTSPADYRKMLGRVMDAAAGGIHPERTIARIWHHTTTRWPRPSRARSSGDARGTPGGHGARSHDRPPTEKPGQGPFSTPSRSRAPYLFDLQSTPERAPRASSVHAWPIGGGDSSTASLLAAVRVPGTTPTPPPRERRGLSDAPL
ncbi:hypothetical protein [Streptomyces sp. DSM 118148]|uniref:hypothetical protein n=1 Tax=Streptomyces sp. DSM 118148 TaxID=3448667 RepID=UPI00403FE33A